MPLYLWRSDALKNYAPGHIIAVGDTAEAARTAALAQYATYDREQHWWWTPDTMDEDDRAEQAERYAAFVADLAKDPEEITGGAVLIKGSE